MRRIGTTAFVLSSACALALSAAAAGAGGPGLTEILRVRFPDRAYVLTTPKPMALGASSVVLLENGKEIEDVSVVPVGQAARRTVGVVLVVDASNSMRGAAISGALDAVRAFAEHRAAREELGIVTFNRKVVVTLAPTTDAAQIEAALARTPKLAEGTLLYDAAARAVTLLSREGIAAGSVVLLTDGRDTMSDLTASELTARARAAGVRLFAVGLRSPQFEPRILAGIARSTGATYSEARSGADLVPVFGALSEQLASEYVLRYRSSARPGEDVRVEARVAGVPDSASTGYRASRSSAEPVPPFHRSLSDRFVGSAWSAAALGLLVGALAAVAVAIPLGRRRSGLRERMGGFVSVGGAREQRLPTRRLSERLDVVERAFARSPWWDRFREELEIAEFPVGAVQLVLSTALLTALAAWALAILLAPLFALFALTVPLIVRGQVKRKLERRREAFAEQLPDNLTVLAAALRVGHSFTGALTVVVDEAEEPSRSEFRRVVSDEQLGVPVEEALILVAQRMGSSDLEQLALVAMLQRETGGNTAEVLDTVVETVRERFDLRRTVKTLTVQGRMTRWILIGLPIVLALLITLINPGYMRPLFETGTGQALIALAIVMVIAGSILIKRITNIEV